ncbi:pheophytinase chloroplastic [Tripterygium wilfordii]|uniref:Pheophytinase chloroplastic n=1 Tax=Tripterygium wilfordii TaxID=458696 RepID=A0A7J7BUJ5_TRIWF|nr:pheophytinase, chloroplastic [Tripterygium wilfordii]KAF5725524.1 pheophytinase chloroplastic [Tripterygium wilfordii]
MANISSPSLSLPNMNLPRVFSQKPMNLMVKTSVSLRKNLFHEPQISFGISLFYRFKGTRFVLQSRTSDFSTNDNQIEVKKDLSDLTVKETEVKSSMWSWRGYSIRYQYSGNSGPALVLIHGFGANSDHWRKNIPVLAKSHRVYAIDLIGYGYSDKPNPRELGDKPFYTFETWGSQLIDFCTDVIKDEVFLICNSIGGLVGLQAAVSDPKICKGIFLLNISLRMLHIKKQPWFGRPLIRSFQSLLRNTPVGRLFYKSVATSESVRGILCQCYHDTTQVTEELVQKILLPGLEPGAADVFLEFICYSEGPLPEELLPQVKCPVLIAWGDKDPWEPIELGRRYGNFDSVEDFIVLPDVGHCPQDEAPQLVNPLVESFAARHATPPASVSAAI